MERGREILRGREMRLRSDKINKRKKVLGARRRQASLIAYAGWKVLGVYLEVKGKTNLHPESARPVCGCATEGLQQMGTAREVNISGNKH